MSPASYRAAPPRAVGLATEVTPPYVTAWWTCKSAPRGRGRGRPGGRRRRRAGRGSGRRRARRARPPDRGLRLHRPLQRPLQPLLRLPVGGEVLLRERRLPVGDRLLRLAECLPQPLLRRLRGPSAGGPAGAATAGARCTRVARG